MKAIIYNYKIWINEIEPKRLVPILIELLHKSDYKVLNFVEHNFSPQGYTCLWLLAESHLALHTFPEENKSYIELSSCNEINNHSFIEKINSWIKENGLESKSAKQQITKP